ncbi:hypothetical protein HanPSC8_Chr06g0239681 [Helianthus annuus]|nr:hypothetical protein HanPSC8_Chr06g0239681 [Helianthus annuus]
MGFLNQNKSSAMLLRSMVFLIFNSIHPMKEFGTYSINWYASNHTRLLMVLSSISMML